MDDLERKRTYETVEGGEMKRLRPGYSLVLSLIAAIDYKFVNIFIDDISLIP